MRFDELCGSEDELRSVLAEVLAALLGEESVKTGRPLPEPPLVYSRVAIRDEATQEVALVEARLGVPLARVLASRMMSVADPDPDDVLDAAAELANISGGSVKSLLSQHSRLSLPASAVTVDEPPEESGGMAVRAVVLGHVVELAITPDGPADDLLWPPTAVTHALERHP